MNGFSVVVSISSDFKFIVKLASDNKLMHSSEQFESIVVAQKEAKKYCKENNYTVGGYLIPTIK